MLIAGGPLRVLQSAIPKAIGISVPMNAWKWRNLCGLADYRKKRKPPNRSPHSAPQPGAGDGEHKPK
jgi:hypothetical protein